MTPFICIKIYGYLKLGDLYILEKTAEIADDETCIL